MTAAGAAQWAFLAVLVSLLALGWSWQSRRDIAEILREHTRPGPCPRCLPPLPLGCPLCNHPSGFHHNWCPVGPAVKR